MIVVTGATGKLGQNVVAQLLEKVPASELAVAVRNPPKASALAARGVQVREADYSRPETLRAALAGASKVLLISSSEVGLRAVQHAAVVQAAKSAEVGLLAYTSILHGERSPLLLAAEHVATENAIKASGVAYAFLRNGWYLENYTEQLAAALQHGALMGSAGEGRIAAAARADFAAAAVAVLTGPGHAGKTYELAGDVAFSMGQLAQEISRQTGKTIGYNDLPPDQYRAALASVGVPAAFADILVDADVGIRQGALADTSGDLRALIGRPTTPLAQAVAAGLAALKSA
jgi:NAD(P)H dehydrogenase (quinone)